jgi:hypothetical protein
LRKAKEHEQDKKSGHAQTPYQSEEIRGEAQSTKGNYHSYNINSAAINAALLRYVNDE